MAMIKRDVPIVLEAGFNQLARCRHGLMLFNSHDQYIGASLRKYGEWSEGELMLFQQLVPSGSVVVEGGANIGPHTVALSKLVGTTGQVHAFEPQRLVFQTLCANLALNGCANVYAYHAAVGARNGEVLVPAVPPDRPANFGGVCGRCCTSKMTDPTSQKYSSGCCTPGDTTHIGMHPRSSPKTTSPGIRKIFLAR